MRLNLTRRRLLTLAAGSAAGAAGGAALAQARPRFLLLSGAAGGVFNEYGPALEAVLRETAGIELDVQPTGGSNDNIRAIGKNEADLGLVNMGPAFDAWHGRKPFDRDGPFKTLRALFPMYETPFSLLALNGRGIASLSDLRGRLVGVGPAGGPGEVFFGGLARRLGIDVRVATGSPTDLARRVLSGEVDAFWFGAGLPVAAFVEVLDRGDAFVFGLTEAELAAFREAFAYVAPYEIPAGTYKGQASPLRTGAIWNFVVTSDRLPEDVAYGITKDALVNRAALQALVPAAAGTAPENAGANSFLPFHPGAARFYREAGVTIPPALVPG